MVSSIRIWKNQLFILLVYLSGFITVSLLFLGFILLLSKGFQSLSLEFLLSPMREGGISGGIFYQILGTLILAITTLFIVFPLSMGFALVKSIYIQKAFVKKTMELFLYILNGIPSVLFGIFGFFFFVKYLGWGKSWFTGGFLLAMMILPTTTLALSEGINRISSEYIENGLALGMRKTQIIFSIILPQSFSSFLSGVLLGLARAVGETAPIMFTATIFSGATIPTGVKESPILSLPYHIFNLVQESYHPQALSNAWGSSLVLIMLVILISGIALPFRLRAHEEAKV